MARPKRGSRPDTRTQILHAALAEFSARGYAATGVDQIARKAKVNKALLYYYFGSKQRLYHELLRDQFGILVTALRAVADQAGDAPAKMDRYIATLLQHLDQQSQLAPMMLRELADGGRHLDESLMREMVMLPAVLFRIIGQGRAEGTFRSVDPLMLHFVLIGTAMVMASNAPLRKRVRQLGLAEPPVDLTPVISQLQSLVRRTILEDPSDAPDAR